MNQNGLTYTDAELILIRQFLHRLAEISIVHYEQKETNKATIIPINKPDHYDKQESIPIHQGKYRRAG